MAINWRIKTYLGTKHGIYSATGLQKIIVKKTGILISLQNLCNYLNKKPRTIRLETIEVLCTALECKFSNFCEIKSGTFDPSKIKKLSFQNTPLKKRASKNFPDPKDY